MRGDLSETSVADLCRGLSDAEATGAVELDGPEGAARVFFRRGNVYWAMSPAPRARLGDRLVNGGLLTADQLESALAAQRESTERLKLGAILVDQGLVSRDVIRVFVQEQILDALFDLMRWRVGTYAFRAGDAVSEKLPIDIPVDQLLVEVSRRQSEWDQIEAAIPHLDMIPDFVLGGSSANAALEPDEFAVLASVDGHRSIRELADALGYSHFEAARIVYGLTLLGIVDVAEDVDEVEPSDDDLYDEVSGVFDGPSDSDVVDADQSDVAPDDEPHEEPDAEVVTDEPGGALDEDDVLAGDLELELSDLAEDDLDIAAALEEALGVTDAPSESAAPEPPSARPSVRVHVDDDVTDYAAPRQVTDSGLSPTGEPRRVDVPLPPPPPAPSTRASEIVEQDEDDLTAALAEALESAGGPAEPSAGEPEAADEEDTGLSLIADLADEDEDEPVDLPVAEEDSDSDEGPAPWVAPADEVAATDPASDLDDLEELASSDSPTDGAAPDADEDLFQGVEPDDETEAPAAASAPDPVTDDSDFDALIDQLAGGPGSSGTDRDAPYTSAPAASETPSSSADESAPERTSSGSGDVSEFLRELSRLALDEPADGGGDTPAKKDDEAEKSEADAASDAAAQSRETQRSASRSESDDKKKRGLFGWGR